LQGLFFPTYPLHEQWSLDSWQVRRDIPQYPKFGKFESESQKIQMQKAKVYSIISSEVFPSLPPSVLQKIHSTILMVKLHILSLEVKAVKAKR